MCAAQRIGSQRRLFPRAAQQIHAVEQQLTLSLRVRLTQSLHLVQLIASADPVDTGSVQLTEYAVQFFCRCKAECLSLAKKRAGLHTLKNEFRRLHFVDRTADALVGKRVCTQLYGQRERRLRTHADKHRFAGKRCQHAPSESAAGGDKNRLRRRVLFECILQLLR